MTDHPHDAGPAPQQGVYAISVAAELSGAPIQSIRLWERHGLLTPARTSGGTRRYSAEDLTRIARITALVTAGVNIAGPHPRPRRRQHRPTHRPISSR
jgi:MerR family transcriptional regulator/heat shock protein HspR